MVPRDVYELYPDSVDPLNSVQCSVTVFFAVHSPVYGSSASELFKLIDSVSVACDLPSLS